MCGRRGKGWNGSYALRNPDVKRRTRRLRRKRRRGETCCLRAIFRSRSSAILKSEREEVRVGRQFNIQCALSQTTYAAIVVEPTDENGSDMVIDVADVDSLLRQHLSVVREEDPIPRLHGELGCILFTHFLVVSSSRNSTQNCGFALVAPYDEFAPPGE
ncbi:hypothetical protein C8F04DRAFT_1116327 [Mycena alexandri]|uniref:Uncharacterized protein n=1 Tax=Mycena alexandri TaxID=1745969 RepID=A0AAD6SNG4_9AGAR|nr:hypothetical protein C8F04DRAFT_1116327 [Mycena alexandri]